MSTKYALSDQDITVIVTKFLNENYASKGFRTATAMSDVNFEGEPVIAVRALYEDASLSADLWKSSYFIAKMLEELGEERSVFVYNSYENEEEEEEEEEEE